MKILRNTQRALSFMGYLPNESMFPIKHGHIISGFIYGLIMVLFIISSTVCLVLHLRIGDYETCLYAGVQIAALFPRIASFATMMYYKDKIRDVFDGFQKISDNCNCSNISMLHKIIRSCFICRRWKTFGDNL